MCYNICQRIQINNPPRSLKLSIYVTLLLVLTSIDYVLNVRWINSMKNYTVISGSILFPLFGLFFFLIPASYYYYRNMTNHLENSKITRKDIMIIATFDGINSLLATIPVPYLSVVIMAIIDKFNLPMVAGSSYIFLNRRYLPSHYLGIFLTLYGISVSFIPNFMDSNIVIPGWWMFLYIMSIIPGTGSYIYKEMKLKEINMDISWFNSWICLYQLFIGILCLPVSIISSKDLTFNNFGTHFGEAFKCQFAGINSNPGDECHYALLWFMLFNVVSTISNILMFLILKEGSAVLFIIIRTLKTPITSYLGSFPQLAGISASPITVADWYAFIMLIVASIVYYYNSELDVYGNPMTSSNSSNSLNSDYVSIFDEDNFNYTNEPVHGNIEQDFRETSHFLPIVEAPRPIPHELKKKERHQRYFQNLPENEDLSQNPRNNTQTI